MKKNLLNNFKNWDGAMTPMGSPTPSATLYNHQQSRKFWLYTRVVPPSIQAAVPCFGGTATLSGITFVTISIYMASNILGSAVKETDRALIHNLKSHHHVSIYMF